MNNEKIIKFKYSQVNIQNNISQDFFIDSKNLSIALEGINEFALSILFLAKEFELKDKVKINALKEEFKKRN